jgi:hypothetical protein
VSTVYDGLVDRHRIVPHWVVRGIQAGLIGAALSLATLLAFQLSRPEPRLALPPGLDGSLILVPAILALSVLTISMPIFMAATRADAILGAVAGFLVAADLLMAVSLIARQSIAVPMLDYRLPLGVVAAVLAMPAAIVGLAAGQLLSEHGFGHKAGIRAVIAATIVGAAAALIFPFA